MGVCGDVLIVDFDGVVLDDFVGVFVEMDVTVVVGSVTVVVTVVGL